MNSKLKVLALSAAVLAGLASAPAHAFVYAESRLLIGSLNIGASGPFAVTNFTFTTTNTAALGAAAAIGTGSCAGSFNSSGTLSSNSCGAGPVLQPAAANAAGGSAAATRASNGIGFFGPAGGYQFSNSSSSINTSELLASPTTTTQQIAESQLQSGVSASASALIQSITGFTFTFTLAAPGTISLRFSANPDQMAMISEAVGGAYSAQSSMSTSFTLQQLGVPAATAQFATWAPTGSAANDCLALNGVTCTETADTQNLNQTIGTTLANDTQSSSHDGDLAFSLFGINIAGLGAGTYSLTLAANTATQLSRLVIPEPETVALLGAGLAALALGSKRRAKKQAA